MSEARKSGDRRIEGLGCFGLAECAERLGDTDAARSGYGDAKTIFEEIGHLAMVVDSLMALGRLHAASDEDSAAIALFEESLALSRQAALHGKEMKSSAWVALIREESTADAEALLAGHESKMPFHEKMEGRFILWKATGKQEHLTEAHRLLVELREHAPEEFRESMIENVPLHKEIMEAFEA